MEELRIFHNRISEHLLARQATSGPGGTIVYFADHGLASNELTGLMAVVKDALRSTTLASFTWALVPLPLIVCAVEVGYGYEGNGTDFWPVLESRLSRSFSIDDRGRLSRLFENSSKQFGGAVPGNSEWEQAFCHIAWPITHAVAAKDIRRPFADCLRRFRGSLDGDDMSIIGGLSSVSTPVGSRRFQTWLAHGRIVAGIVRDLLGGPKLAECGLFSESFSYRLIEDLRKEPEIQRAVRSTRSRREKDAAKKEKKASSRKRNEPEYRLGDFFLRRDEHGEYAIFGELPEMPRTVQTRLRGVRRKWQPKPWGFAGATTLPSDTLRSVRGTFPVEMSYVARANIEKPFFVAIEELSLDTECAAWLASIRFPAGEKLVFHPIVTEGDTSHAITSPTPHSGIVWVLTKTTCNWPEISREKIGETVDGELNAVDASDSTLRSWLGWPEVRDTLISVKSTVRWIYPTPVLRDDDGRRGFTTDDEIGILTTSGVPVVVKLLSDGRELDEKIVNEVALINLEQPGNYELIAEQDGKVVESFQFAIIDQIGDGFIEPDPEYPWHCNLSHIDPGISELSRSDLFNRRLVLDIEADRTIENIPVIFTLNPGNSTAKLLLPRIPVRLGVRHSVWNELLDGMPSSVVTSACDLTLSVTVANIASEEWRLEPELHSVWWNNHDSGIPKAMTDRNEMEVVCYSVITGKQNDNHKQGYPFVSVAVDEQGAELLFDSRVSVIGDACLQIQLERPNRFLRQMDDIGSNPGLRSIANRYLALASATSDSVGAEVNRVGAVQKLRQWMVASLCGSNWVVAQEHGSVCEEVNPIAIWWQVQHKHSDLIQPKPDEARLLPAKLPDLILADLFELLPYSWWDGHVADIGVDYATALDAFYKCLLEGEDVFVDSDVLARTLREANNMVCGAHLAQMVIPITGGDDLMRWSVTDCSLKELAESLLEWIRIFLKKGRGRQSWTKEELHAYLNLLLFPEQLRKTSWQSVLEKLLHDRPVARAGAFLAWRIEQNTRMSSCIDDLMQLRPSLAISDSVQTLSTDESDSSLVGSEDEECL